MKLDSGYGNLNQATYDMIITLPNPLKQEMMDVLKKEDSISFEEFLEWCKENEYDLLE